MTMAEWQTRLDKAFPDGVRVSQQPDGWDMDPENVEYFSIGAVVESMQGSWPYLRIRDAFGTSGQADHYFQTTGEEATDFGLRFTLEEDTNGMGGVLVLTPYIPPGVKQALENEAALDNVPGAVYHQDLTEGAA